MLAAEPPQGVESQQGAELPQETDDAIAKGLATKGPALKLTHMILFSVCAVLLLAQLTVTARIGPTAIFWTLAITVLFFVPYGLATSELGSTYPDAGGIYSWIVRAFGKRWGTRVSWWYWVNVALWVPSVYLMFAGTLSSMFFGGELNFWIQVAITLVLIWVNYWVNARSLSTGAWVSNLGAAITVLVIVVLGVAAAIFGSTSGSATEWSLAAMLPTGGISAVALALPIIITNLVGFELMSSASTEMQNPKRDVPRTILISGLLVAGLYLLATVAMQVILPADEISETTGLIDSLRLALGTSDAGNVVVAVVGIGALYCFFACLIPWTIGANLSAAQSSIKGDLPKFFGRTHPTAKTPTGAALLCSIVGTVVTLAYALFSVIADGGVDDLFWSLFAFSSVISLLPYILLMQAFAKLRKIDPAAVRPYRVPGRRLAIAAVTWMPSVLLVLAALLFVANPFEFDPMFTTSVLIGIAITVAIQEYFCHRAPTWASQREAEAVERERGVGGEGVTTGAGNRQR